MPLSSRRSGGRIPQPSRNGPWFLDALRHHRLAVALSVGALLAQAGRLSPLADPLGQPVPAGWRLSQPFGYSLLAPLFSLWDQVAMLSRSRLTGFLLGLALGYLAWRIVARRGRRLRPVRVLVEEVRVALTALAALALFVSGGMAWNTRPVRRLVGLDADDLTVEVHSHTNQSHDVRSWPVAGFDAEQDRRWHERAGVDVLFITDHNVNTGWSRYQQQLASGETLVCPGLEVSAHGAHVVVLGDSLPDDPLAYRGTAEHRARLFREVAATPGALALASLPEYRGQAAEFLAEGVGGFEIVNASPKGNEIPRAERDSVVALARAHRVPVVAAGDQHGYGATPMAWNVLREPGWRGLGEGLCAVVVARLKVGGVGAVRIVERRRLRPDHPVPAIATPLGVVWLAWATVAPLGAVSWIAWIWLLTVGVDNLRHRLRAYRARAIMSTVGSFTDPSSGRS